MTGTWGLIRLILRRDRWLMPLWIVILGILPMMYAAAFKGVYHTAAGRAEYAHSIAVNPSLMAMLGPVYSSSLGGLAVWRSNLVIVIIGLASMLTVIRHTRTEEQAGRRELLGATVVGRDAPLFAALITTAAADVVLGAIAGLGVAASGTSGVSALAFGLTAIAAGWMFAAIGGLAAQLTEGAGGARGLGLVALAASYGIRAAADTTGVDGSLSWLNWLSPLGWLEQVRPYAGDRWWVLVFPLALTVGATAGAYALTVRRDLDAGLLPSRLGPERGPGYLGTPLGLAFRLHRTLLIGWTTGFVLMGLAMGPVANSARDMMSSSAQVDKIMKELGGASAISDAFIAVLLSLAALAASAYTIQAGLRMRTEETALRAEPVLATRVGRIRWAASHLTFSLLGPAVAMIAVGLAIGISYGLAAHDVGGQLPRVLAAALVQMPAVWVLSGLTLALFGVAPRLAPVAWAALAAFLLLGQIGPILRLNHWAMDASPFTHVPKLPGVPFTATPLVVLVAVALVLGAVGLVGFRRRDIG